MKTLLVGLILTAVLTLFGPAIFQAGWTPEFAVAGDTLPGGD